VNCYRTISLGDGSEWACNREGEGVFSRGRDGTWRQHAGTGQAGPFRSAADLSRHVRARYLTECGERRPGMVRGSAHGWS
jgi:hypothetical protein